MIKGPAAGIVFRQVTKSYAAQPVLKNLDLTLPPGRTTAIVGASGSGKTTLLQLINGLEVADAGVVEVFGAPVPLAALEGFRRRIGYSVQGAGLFPHMTIADNVTLVARLDQLAASDIQQRLAELFEAMELPLGLAQRFPHELSGGQQQRVGLCRALMMKPELLLLDEPFSAIDPITRVEVYRLFAQVQAGTGVSTVLVTHDMREAHRLADELVILRGGQVLQYGTTEQIVAQPADDYVRTLVREQL